MEFTIANLLSNFTDDKLIAPKVLEKKLGLSSDISLRQLQIALDALEKMGILIKDRGRYRRGPGNGLVEGKLRCSSKGFCFAIQDDEEAEDIYIRESNLSTAWNGDRVFVRVLKEGSRRRSPEGEVFLIIDRAITSVLARIKWQDGDYKAVPLDDRLLFELSLPNNGTLESAIEHLVHVSIERYPLGPYPPIGEVTQVLGLNAEEAADTEIVRCKHDLPKIFSPAVLEEAANLQPQGIGPDDRQDLRSILTFTIKPGEYADQTDTFDDAISVEPWEGGNWRLGIHIADVSDWIPPNCAIDQAAAKRGVSVYLGHKVLPMLPPEVTQHCALIQGQERRSLSVLIILDSQGQVQEYTIEPTVISVDHHLNYQQTQALLVAEEPVEDLPAVLGETVKQLYSLTQQLRQHRLARGSFELNLPDQKYHYDDEGSLGALVVPFSLPARGMVTELMILANQLVAKHLRELQVPALYRVHQAPHVEEIHELIKLAANLGIGLELEEEEEVKPRDYQNFTGQFDGTSAQKVLTYLLLGALKPAFYSIAPKPHFGLAVDEGYTHFTAPLHRYSDLLIHRVLHEVFTQGRDRRNARAKEGVNLTSSSCHGKINWNVLPPDTQADLEDHFSAMVAHLSEAERIAQEAIDDLDGLQKAEFMKSHTGEIFHGVITGVQSYGFFVELEDALVEGLVHVSSLKDDWYEYRSRQQMLIGRKNRNHYRLGDRVEVQVKSVDYYRQQIDLVAISGGSYSPDSFDDEEEEDEDYYN
ncbi:MULTISPECIES: ribonuclease R [unclassified Roseofilum]|uniref:ribonuclease R family protein n=1 Tax=unclassified Roseofilum TaxID=2620099 RepID=UPI001B2A68F4|nr:MULTISPECIES: ribonuclease R [unclassified Roseofilum]MBP0006855.1 VacB/RNase II family 3'-5' exoribonuclease [Roseofilum sp. Belize Diploria]MBP0035872.1 VacB/RNase II family 3'-5' exoribonuclease [Roseofilum sp. Belize BBD 4]